MRTLRIAVAAFMVLLGAMLIAAWSIAGKTVSAVESGEAASNLTQQLLADPDFATTAAEAVVDSLAKQTEGSFLNNLVEVFRPQIEDAVIAVLGSDRLGEAVTQSVSTVSEQLSEELTEPNRPTAPFVLSVDLSDRINERIDEIPVIGALLPAVTVPPVQTELIDAEAFDSIRSVYGAIGFVAGWGLVLGLVLIAAGFFVAPRSRWYWPQAALGAAFVALAVSVVVRRVVPSSIASAVPGGADGGAGAFIKNFISESTTGPIATRLLLVAFLAMLFAVAFAFIARRLPQRPND